MHSLTSSSSLTNLLRFYDILFLVLLFLLLVFPLKGNVANECKNHSLKSGEETGINSCKSQIMSCTITIFSCKKIQDIGYPMWALGTACCPNSVIIPVSYNSVEIFLQKIHKTETQALPKNKEENKRVCTK